MRNLAEAGWDISAVPATPAARQRSMARLVFSFPGMLAVALVVLTVLTVRSRFDDPDLWWHLKTGEIIWTTHSIPQTDLFSFTTNNHAYTPHEWLAQVTIYGAWKWGGYTGLMVWLCVLPSLLLIAIYALGSLYSGNVKVALVGALVAWFFATIGLGIRPHIIGYLLLACELLLVHLGRSRNQRWFLLLPPLFAIWVNCHGSFLFGLIVLGVFLFCSCLKWRSASLLAPRWEKSRRNTLALAFVLSIAALFVNPIGMRQVLYPLDVIFGQSTGLGAVDEWQPLAFDNPRAFGLLAVAGSIFLLTLLRRCKIRIEELLLLAMGFGMAVRHSRMLFVFGVLVAPILCRMLADAWDHYDFSRDRIAPNAVMMLIGTAVIVLAFPDRNQLDSQVRNANPVKAVEFIRRTGLSGRMLNEYGYGGYLIWALPERKVFMDGRADVYEWTGVLDEFAAWTLLREDPKILLNKYRIDFCLLSRNAPMSRVLPYLPGWKSIYSDERSVIFRLNRPGSPDTSAAL